MGIEQAFGFGREAEIIYVGQRADYRPYEKRIAYLEGQVEGLTAVARQNKFLADKNGVLVDLFKDTLRALIAQGRVSREEVNAVKESIERKLPPEDLELIFR